MGNRSIRLARRAAPIADLAGAFASLLRRWGRRARQRRALALLDDRLLRDIGLTRAQVDPEADKPSWLK